MPKEASHFDISWQAMKLPEAEADTSVPTGRTLDFSGGQLTTCDVTLPWPPQGVGAFTVVCRVCRQRVSVTTTGENSDPTSVVIACHAAPRGAQYAAASTS